MSSSSAAARLVEQRRVGEVNRREPVAIVAPDPSVECGGERVVEARRWRARPRARRRSAQAQAQAGAAAVAHALPESNVATSAMAPLATTRSR